MNRFVFSAYHVSARAALILLIHFLCDTSRAGGGPQNVLVVVNDRSIESLEVGQYYQERRGIPERNICHVSVDPLSYSLANADFQTAIVERVSRHLTDLGLSNQIDYIVLSKDLPSRVSNLEGATAVLFYGFKNAPGNPPCFPLLTGTQSFYYQAEQAFSHQTLFNGNRYYLSSILTAENLVFAKALVDRGMAADGTAPGGKFFLLKPAGDPNRNVRYKLFDNFDFNARFQIPFPDYSILNADVIVNQTNVLGYLTGRPDVPDSSGFTNHYLPGALADHFTSVGGFLPDGLGQGTVWQWIRAGASASFGSVAEPCAFLEKFPNPLVFYWYARGFSLGESYSMSVAHPYRGIFVGDPLTAPFAFPPVAQITNVFTNQVVSGVVTVQVAASTGAVGRLPYAMDLYLDDRLITNLVTAAPATGNVLAVSINNITCAYEVVSGNSLYDAVKGMAASINASNLPVRAQPFGDRIELVYTNFGYFGSSITYRVAAYTGAASEQLIGGRGLTSNLLECVYPAREYIVIQGTANSGDTVSCSITLTNSVVASNIVVAGAGEPATSLMVRLTQIIHSNSLLQVTNGVRVTNYLPGSTFAETSLEARNPGPEGFRLFVNYRIARAIPSSGLITNDSFADHFNDNAEVLTARGEVQFWCGRDPLTAAYAWDTTNWPEGPHTIRVVAKEGTGPEIQGHQILPVVVSNTSFACALSSPTNFACFVLGSNVSTEAVITNAAGVVTQVTFFVEQKTRSVVTSLPYTTSWSTLDYGVGSVSVQAEAFDNSGRAALSRPVEIKILMSPTLDTDGDGVSDAWEQEHFGGLYVYGATNDPDRDRVRNLDEYVADTDPLDSNRFLYVHLQAGTNGEMLMRFPSSSNRWYAAQFTDHFATNGINWYPASILPFMGTGTTQTWVDDGGETGTNPGQIPQRTYRLRVQTPP